MEIIDAHVHIYSDENYVLDLLTEMNHLGISKACISGLGSLFNSVSNKEILHILEDHSSRFIGTYFVRPGVTNALAIQNAYDQGFQMLKVSIPKKPYDDPTFFPLWGAAQRLGMPVLFHTGIVTVYERGPKEIISSWNMHPLRIETIANSFPDLNIIIAHLGGHWNKDAAELARMKHNVYVDLSGEPEGWRRRVENEGFEKYLWWENAFKKIIFGTNVTADKISIILREDKNRYEEKLQLDSKTKELIFSGNIKKMLKIKGEGLS